MKKSIKEKKIYQKSLKYMMYVALEPKTKKDMT